MIFEEYRVNQIVLELGTKIIYGDFYSVEELSGDGVNITLRHLKSNTVDTYFETHSDIDVTDCKLLLLLFGIRG